MYSPFTVPLNQWEKKKTYVFTVTLDTVIIEAILKNETVSIEKYQLVFDDLKRLTSVYTFKNGILIETTTYTYGPNSITGFIERTMAQGVKWTYRSKAVLNSKGDQIEKVILSDDGTEEDKMIVAYNDDRTIRSIKYGKTIQDFTYIVDDK